MTVCGQDRRSRISIYSLHLSLVFLYHLQVED